MKPVNVFLVIILLSLLSTCKKDEMESGILGKWYPETGIQNLYENGNKYNSTTYIPSEKTFNADGTGLMTAGDTYSKPFSWKLESDTLTITLLSEYEASTTSKWSVLYIRSDSFQIKNTIKQISNLNQEYMTESIETYRK